MDRYLHVIPGFDGAKYGQQFAVDKDGTIRVFDEVAGHFTVHHGLTQKQEVWVRTHASSSPIGTTIPRPDMADDPKWPRHIG